MQHKATVKTDTHVKQSSNVDVGRWCKRLIDVQKLQVDRINKQTLHDTIVSQTHETKKNDNTEKHYTA